MASRKSEQPMRIYVGERYLPGASADQAMAGADRIRAAATNLSRNGSRVRLLSTTFVPEEEWMFDLFEADASSEIEHIYAAAQVAVGRVSRAIHIPRTPPSATGPRDPLGGE